MNNDTALESYNEGMFSDKTIADHWAQWVESLPSDDARHREIYPYLTQWIQKHAPVTVLEIGSGQGECSEKIKFGSATYIGVEPSVHLRERAVKLYPGRFFVPGKAEELQFARDSFDAAFSVFVWFHIENLDLASRELARILKPGGTFVVVTANPESYALWKSWHANATVEGKLLRGDMSKLPGSSIYLHTIEDMEQSLRAAGLTIDEMVECGYENEQKLGKGFALIISGYK